MLDAMRKPFLFLAAILVALAVLVEIGAMVLVQPPRLTTVIPPDLEIQLRARGQLEAAQRQMEAVRAGGERPPGFGVPALALVDILYLLTAGLMALSLVVGFRVHARVQGIIGLVVSILVIFAAIKHLFAALIELMIRVSLLLAVPFGTIAYMAIYAFFDRSGAGTVLALSWSLKIGAVVCLFLAQQRYLRQAGLLLMVLTSFLASFIVSFLHGLPPTFLVSITDPIAGIVCDILALIWGIVFALYGIIAVVKALKPS
jgi:hypothetical protein